MSNISRPEHPLVGSRAENRAVLHLDADDPKRALVVWTVGVARTPYVSIPGADLVVTDEACDLTDLNKGRAPLLLDHDMSTCGVIGVVEAAWIESSCGWAIVRFGNGPRARAAMRDVRDGILCNASVGFTIQDAETVTLPDGASWQRIVAWRPYEISIVAVGEDRAAHLRISEGEVAERLIADREALQKAARRQRRRAALQAEAWERWAVPAGDVLAERFHLDRLAITEALSDMVRDQIAALTGPSDA